MAPKRKLDLDSDDVMPTNSKQLKLVPFPNYEPDNDVAMSDVESIYTPHHTRYPSNVSASSASSDSSSPSYPSFDIYPTPFFNSNNEMVDSNSVQFPAQSPNSPNHNVGLLQPANTLAHHGTGCSQIPKLKVACAPGLQGQRTMWSFCEQCGAISMVDTFSS